MTFSLFTLLAYNTFGDVLYMYIRYNKIVSFLIIFFGLSYNLIILFLCMYKYIICSKGNNFTKITTTSFCI